MTQRHCQPAKQCGGDGAAKCEQVEGLYEGLMRNMGNFPGGKIAGRVIYVKHTSVGNNCMECVNKVLHMGRSSP